MKRGPYVRKVCLFSLTWYLTSTKMAGRFHFIIITELPTAFANVCSVVSKIVQFSYYIFIHVGSVYRN